jgi:quinol monooxygenase YgiN
MNNELAQTVSEIVNTTRKKKGWKSSHFYRDIESDNGFSLVEEWETQADLDSHLRSNEWRVLIGAVRFLCKQPEIKLNTVAHTTVHTAGVGMGETGMLEAG